MKKLGTVLIPAVALLMLCGLSVGFTAAYLSSDPGTAVNVITVGSVDIRLEEPSWDPEKAQELHPREQTAKDPLIVNTGENPARVFLEIRVPVKDLALVSDDGKKMEPKICRLFTYTAEEKYWELIHEEVKGGTANQVFAYRRILNPGEKTEPLFTTVSVANYLEGSVDPEEKFTIGITAKAIQDGVETRDHTSEQIYEELLRQTGETDSTLNEAESEDRGAGEDHVRDQGAVIGEQGETEFEKQ